MASSMFNWYGSGHPLPDSIHLLLVSESDHEPVHPAMREYTMVILPTSCGTRQSIPNCSKM